MKFPKVNKKALKGAAIGAMGGLGALGGAIAGHNEKGIKKKLGLDEPGQEEFNDDGAMDEYQRAAKEFAEGGAAQYANGSALNYQDLSPDQLAKLRRSNYDNVSTDPRLAEAQMDAMRQLEEISQTGMNARDRADMAKLEADVNRRNAGRMGAIQQNMAARGMSGSGMDLVAQMQASQDATEREAMAALEKNAQIGERKERAMMQRGSLAGDMRSQDFSEQARKAEAQDAIDRFNAANSVNAQMQNNRGMNDTNQANWNRRNQTSDRNTQAGYDFRKDKLGAAQGGAQMKYNSATDEWNRKEMERQRKAGRFGRMFGGAAQGAIAGGSVGGPWGAAAGGVLGAAANYAHGGRVTDDDFDVTGGFKVPGEPRYPFDTEANDTVQINATPGEIVVPLEAAQNPETAAQFAAQAASEPQDQFSSIKNPAVRQYMRDKYTAKKELEQAQNQQKWMGAANVAGKLVTDALNNKQQDVILRNRMQDLGQAPKVVAAKRNEWDGSMLDNMGAAGVDRAKGKLAQAGQDFKDGMVMQEHDAGSQQSKAAQLVVKSVLASKAKEAEAAGDKAAAAQLRSMDVSGMSAADAKDLYEGAKHVDYKDVLNNLAADKRINSQITADEKRYGRDQEKQERKEKDARYKRSVEMRKELNQNPAFKALAETEARLTQVDELIKNPNGVNDEAILVMYQKALDPGSVVREGEFARTAAGQSLIGRVDNIMQQYAKGTRMTPELRKEVVQAMKALRDGNRMHLQKVLSPYEREIRDYDLDRSIILQADEPAAPGGTAAPNANGASTTKKPAWAK